jgi:hypothetical protein
VLTKVALPLAALLGAATLAVSLLGCSSGRGDSRERNRALADGRVFLKRLAPGQPAFHVSGAKQVRHNVWRVEVEANRPHPPPPKYACLTIQLDRFAVHVQQRTKLQVRANVRGVRSDFGRCP